MMGTAWVLSGVIGYALGSMAAMNRGKMIDRAIKWYSYTLVSTPIFWMGLILMIVFAVWLHWFPVGLAVPAGVMESEVRFIDRLHHFVLPAVTLSILGVANVAMHTREKMIDILNSEYIVFARARGESGWQIFKTTASATPFFRRFRSSLRILASCLEVPCLPSRYSLIPDLAAP
ncbi:hypothetical protein HMSSN036_71540 [Paenibacillus macerans]|nr:hypothetical protein HMSSN036_71540 [Paenibacillus macerans]